MAGCLSTLCMSHASTVAWLQSSLHNQRHFVANFEVKDTCENLMGSLHQRHV